MSTSEKSCEHNTKEIKTSETGVGEETHYTTKMDEGKETTVGNEEELASTDGTRGLRAILHIPVWPRKCFEGRFGQLKEESGLVWVLDDIEEYPGVKICLYLEKPLEKFVCRSVVKESATIEHISHSICLQETTELWGGLRKFFSESIKPWKVMRLIRCEDHPYVIEVHKHGDGC